MLEVEAELAKLLVEAELVDALLVDALVDTLVVAVALDEVEMLLDLMVEDVFVEEEGTDVDVLAGPVELVLIVESPEFRMLLPYIGNVGSNVSLSGAVVCTMVLVTGKLVRSEVSTDVGS